MQIGDPGVRFYYPALTLMSGIYDIYQKALTDLLICCFINIHLLFYKHSSQRNITSKIKGERKHQQNRIIMGTPRPIIKRISLENLSAPVSKINILL